VKRQPTELLKALVALIRRGLFEDFAAKAAKMEPADLGDVLASLDGTERVDVVRRLPPEVSSQALAEMPDEAHRGETLAALDPTEAAHIVEQLDDDDAADILGELEPAKQQEILAEVEDRPDVERLLRYDEETAGGLMTTHLVSVLVSDTVAGALESVRKQAEETEDFGNVFVVDGASRLMGVLSFKTLVVSDPDRRVEEVMEPPDVTVGPEEDQEEVARLMARYNVPSIPVVDADGRLLGRVTFDDVIDVVEAETTEDILRFGGVSAHEDLAASWGTAVKSRAPWVFVNLLTAFIASSVIVLFEDVLVRAVALAAYLPIVAGLGGNTGTQALAVTVRRLALRQIPVDQSVRVIRKEMAVGLTNGLLAGSAVAIVALATGQGPQLGLVVLMAMVGNLFLGSSVGALVPLLLNRLGVDPAIASSIFVTAFTDTCGFALLLGLSSWIIL
jgi:magnesium transporter